jgi:hypothetical protein
MRIYLDKPLLDEENHPYEVRVVESIQPRTAAILRRTLAHTHRQLQREPFDDVWFADRSYQYCTAREILIKDKEDAEIPNCVICLENYEQDH